MIFNAPKRLPSVIDLTPGGGIGGGLPQNQPVQPFLWDGNTGGRLTPEEILARQETARADMQSNYSPVSSIWEGLGRIADPVIGALDLKRLDKMSAENQAESNRVLEALMSGQGGDVAAAALTNPYLSKDVKSFAGKVWERDNPKPQQPNDWERLLIASGVQPGTPEWAAANKTKVDNTLDPWTSIVSGGESISGRQSLVQQALGGGDPASQPVGGGSAPTGGFADFAGAQSLLRSMGPQGFLSWQGQHGTPVEVTSKAQLDALPSGTKVINNGRIAVKP